MLAIHIGRSQHVADGLCVGFLVNLVKALEHELRGGARHREDLRHRRTLRQHAAKIRLRPDTRKIDPAVVNAIGVDESRDQSERQIVAIDGMGSKQRPAGFKLDGPEAVEFDCGLPAFCKWRPCKLRRDMKAQGSAGMPWSRWLRNI